MSSRKERGGEAAASPHGPTSGTRETRRATPISQPPTKLYRGRVADQIVEDLRSRILSGALPDGAQLPSERELASHYDVSGPTIRESVRVLTAMGLLSTRNGTRTTVTARGDALLAMSIASVVQFEKMSAADVFGVLEALYACAVKLAVERASEPEIASLRKAAEQAGEIMDVESGAATLLHYYATLSALSHNQLLAALCRSITEIKIGFAVKLSRGSIESWRRVAGSLHGARMDIVDAVARRDADRAVQLVCELHRKVVQRIHSSPSAKELSATDPKLTALLSAWLGANLRLGGGLAWQGRDHHPP
jgi:GntR family transcriptional regulator, transcriptional repressor for pyruvate dehydrogenase complex